MAIAPVPTQGFLPQGPYGGIGPTPVEQTYTQAGMPDWMRQTGPGYQYSIPMGGKPGGAIQPEVNWFAMPEWGTSAATGEPLTQQDLQPQPIAPPPQAPVAPPAPEVEQSRPDLAFWQGRAYESPMAVGGDMARERGGMIAGGATPKDLRARDRQMLWDIDRMGLSPEEELEVKRRALTVSHGDRRRQFSRMKRNSGGL